MTAQAMQKSDVVAGMLASVMAYEHPELVQRFKHKLEMSDADAEQLFVDTKRYLYLCAISGKPLAPPAAIDQGWHEFLMYTKDYQEFCLKHLGKFVHHTPNPVLHPHEVLRISDTSQLAAEHFGELSQNWRVYADDCSPDYDCNGGPSCQ